MDHIPSAVTSVRIERRERAVNGTIHPFSEVFITSGGLIYCTRLFYPLDDSPHARAAQKQDFIQRQRQEMV